ncbi:MAG: LysR family transcriptional regulator [Lachnospiraceae bacterium]|nr:LysR family transcriptional regulator [Lachnospiraceae bacterium]
MHIAQPSLTQCIQRLEKSLSCPLFYRKKQG